MKELICLKDVRIGEQIKCRSKFDSQMCANQNRKPTVYRAVRESGDNVFVYGKGRRKYGNRYTEKSFENLYEIIAINEETTQKWHKRISKLIELIKQNQLWEEHLVQLQNLFLMTWEDHEKIASLYWLSRNYNSKEWTEWFDKYPFLKVTANDGSIYPNTFYLWELSQAKTKSMWFGYRNKDEKLRIAEALNKKEPIRIFAKANYDVSFEYNPEKGMAWYSEEYRGCGNGHYYLAVSENTAWFCEND